MRSKMYPLCVVLTISVFFYFCSKTLSAATLPFEDGFENIAVGDYPDENGWTPTMVGGMDAVVSDDRSFSGTRSFRFMPLNGGARLDYVEFSQFDNAEQVPPIEYSFAVWMDSSVSEVIFILGDCEMSGEGYFTCAGLELIYFDVAGRVFYAPPQSYEEHELGSWEPGRWHTVRVTTDLVGETQIPFSSIYFDDNLVIENISIAGRHAGQLWLYTFTEAGASIYFDDIKMYECSESDVPTLIDNDVVDLYADVELEDFFRYILSGCHIYAHVSAVVDNPEMVESVEVEVTGTSPSLYQLGRIGNGDYELTLKFDILPVEKVLEFLLKHFVLGTIILPPPPHEEVKIVAFIINDTAGQSHRYVVNKPLKSFVEHALEYWRTGQFPRGRVSAFTAYSPVDVLVTDVASGTRIGTLWNSGGPQELDEIDHGLYTGSETHPEFVAVFPSSTDGPSSPYIVDIYGRTSGEYALTIATFQEGVVLYEQVFKNVSIENNKHHLYVRLPNDQEELMKSQL